MLLLSNIAGAFSMILLLVHTLLYYYLEVSNNHFNLLSYKTHVGLFYYYDKEVKDKDKKIMQFSNITLKYGALSFGILIAVLSIKEIFDI